MTWLSAEGTAVTKPVTVSNEKLGHGVYVSWKNCGRCGGAGGSEAWRFTGWTCYECAGEKGKYVELKAYTPEAYAKLEALRAKAADRRAAKQQAKEEAAAAAFQAWATQNAAAVEAIQTYKEENGILADFATRMQRSWTLSEKQLAFAASLVEEAKKAIEARNASKHFGEVGKRYKKVALVQVVQLASGNSVYGFWAVYKLVTVEGATLIYKGSALLDCFKQEAGQDPLLASFTVKEHTEYQGSLQTVVQRVSF